VLRAVLLGLLTGFAAIIGLAYILTGRIGPPPPAADVCAAVDRPALGEVVVPTEGVKRATVCEQIDTDLDLPLAGVDGFQGVAAAPDPPSDPAVPKPDYLVWETDGCSAPVLGKGPFDFTVACTRHDFGWRNLKQFHEDDAPTWHVANKDRVDSGFLYDMRQRCASVAPVWRIGCDTTARVYYTAVRLNPSGVQGLPGRSP
jgi:hypothetical protein